MKNPQIANFAILNLCYHYPGGDIVDINKIESAVNDLNAIRHILLHMASSEYLINTPDSEICRFLAESLNRVRWEIEEGMG